MALTLRRKWDQTLHIIQPDGTTVVVRVTGVRGGNVWLSVEAPKEVTVLRGELVPPPKEEPARA